MLGGVIRSTSPRLIGFTRIMGFFGVWLLTDASDIIAVSRFTFTELFFPMLFAASFSLLATCVGHFWLPPARSHLGDGIGRVLEHVCDVLEAQVETVTKGSSIKSINSHGIFEDVKTQYGHAVHSITIAPTSPRQAKALIKLITENLRRSVVVKGGGPLFETESHQVIGLDSELCEKLTDLPRKWRQSLNSCQVALDQAWGSPRPFPKYSLPGLLDKGHPKPVRHVVEELEEARQSLTQDLVTFQSLLVKWLEGDQPPRDGRIGLERSSQQRLQIAHWLVGILDVSHAFERAQNLNSSVSSSAAFSQRLWTNRSS